MADRFPAILASFAALVSVVVLMRVITTDGGTLRVALAAGGFLIFLALAIAVWTRTKT